VRYFEATFYFYPYMNFTKQPPVLLAIVFILFIPSETISQVIPVGSLQDEQLRIQALLSDSTNFSFVNRPVSHADGIRMYDGSRLIDDPSRWWSRSLNRTEYQPIEELPDVRIGLNPLFIQNTLNTRFPYGENNAAAWYGRGFNTEFQGGFYITSSYVTINVNPHIIHQQNQDFLYPRFISTTGGQVNYFAEGIGTSIDAPFRFGPDPYTTIDPGTSSIRLHYKKFETGLSSEPLWWGGAARYPLIMSNNAPGIPHFFIGTREAVRIPYFGYIQFRWMMGYPKDSGYFDSIRPGESRFTNAANIAYSLPFFKNLAFGFTRVYHIYEEDGFDIQNALVLFDPLRKASLVARQGSDRDRQRRNQTASIYMHLHLPEANAEIYGEFFREDHSFDFRDLFIQPHHNSAYSLGFQKISYVPWFDFIKTNLEFTNLTISQLSQVRPQAYYYTHTQIRHGHTSRGQVLGAAIGPGSNSQFFSLDTYKNNFKVGLFAQRLADNDSFHLWEGSAANNPSPNYGDYFRHRIDLNFGLNFLYGPGPYYINSSLVWTRAYNYGRFGYGDFDGVNISNYDRFDRTNIQFQIGITYIL
jgi:hypothetical protein